MHGRLQSSGLSAEPQTFPDRICSMLELGMLRSASVEGRAPEWL